MARVLVWLVPWIVVANLSVLTGCAWSSLKTQKGDGASDGGGEAGWSMAKANCYLKWLEGTSRTPTTDALGALVAASVDDKVSRNVAMGAWVVGLVLQRVDRHRYIKACSRDEEIRMNIVAKSIEAYKQNTGACPCPYNLTKQGHRCGDRSAYSKQGGEKVFCYTTDVTDEEVARWRRSE